MSDSTNEENDAGSPDGFRTDRALFADLPVAVTVSVGSATPTISALLDLRPESIIPLDKSVDDPVDVFVGDRLIARGLLEEIETESGMQLAVRLTSVPGLPDGV